MDDSTDLRFQIRELLLPETVSGIYSTGTFGNRLTALSRLNVFIGPNNSGKSILLRALFADPNVRFSPPSNEFEQLRTNIDNLVLEAIRSCSDESELADFIPTISKIVAPFRGLDGAIHVAPDAAPLQRALAFQLTFATR